MEQRGSDPVGRNVAPEDVPSANVTVESPAVLAELAVDIAEAAADHVRRRRPELFGGPGPQAAEDGVEAVTTKSTPTDPVTLADTETEQLIRDRLRTARPADEILGEESGGAVDVPTGVRWVVDPIDGTVNFMYGIPAYAVSVAAQVDGRSVAGAVVDVARAVTYHAAEGGGAFLRAGGETVPLRCNDIERVELALVATGFGYDAERRREQGAIVAQLLPRVRDLRRIGAAALDLCMVASGAVDAHIEHGLSPWDWAAGGLIAAEAGAVVHLPPADSRSCDGHATIAVAPGIADAFVALLEDLGARRALPARD
ncbi:inositol monophosphatase SuhB [Gordonia polyisoprenivorans NBRC 16320 = JCM 10675]|uniref:Inositol-1-monophosphatase n=1 Tax=Gordonia polyisoprenivorans TaxID=84595 RepID=A0A846WMG5_9ACTN|nr:inositol monophosphatase family protein [Gordonia polyisoprenivorans]NKY02788.1 inositol monophosphatase [Gordonia polyisoprenivorans]OZC30306.1 inositol monophosphatase [Gordonia polyisoprenivorans]UZF58630.1 inositol monophosphatase [Gordonia polyisoprenivorans]GAB24460.1 inositol monophosphatase SuhB [Gordonia polyisoprenivorans NBRC 16320 = JCM 10675]